MDIREEIKAIRSGKHEEVLSDIENQVLLIQEKEFLINFCIFKEKINKIILENKIPDLKLEINFNENETTFYIIEDLFYPESCKLTKEEEKMYNVFAGLLAYSCDKLTTAHHEFFGWIKDHNTVIDLCSKECNSLDDFLLSDKLKALLNKNLLELELLDKAVPTKKLKL